MGRVIEVLVAVGVAVGAGDDVAVIESMKVEIPVAAPTAGTVGTVCVAPGDRVQAGDLLLTIVA